MALTDRAGVPDLDAHQAGLTCLVEQAGDLEAAQPELLADLHLGQPVDVVPPSHRRGEHQPRGTGLLRVRHGPPPALI
jgi:hypothetical protein